MFGLLLQAAPKVPTLSSDLVIAFVFLDVALILLAARICGLAAVKVGQPRVVGEIIAGVLLGPTLLGPTIFAFHGAPDFLHCDVSLAASSAKSSISSCVFPPQSKSVLGILGQIALAFFMFLVGLEMDLSLLKGRVVAIVVVAIGVVAIPIALGFAITPALYNAKFVGHFGASNQPSREAFSLMVGAMMSVTAFPVMARILQEKGLTSSVMGAIGVAAAAIVTILMFLVVTTAVGVANEDSGGKFVFKYVYVAIYLGVMIAVVRPALAPLGRYYEKNGLTPDVLAIVLLLLFASAYVAHQLEVSAIVGGFMAGVVLPARANLFRDMSAKLSDVTGVLLLPIFLAVSGLSTDFTKLKFNMAAGIAVFLVAGIAGKWAGGAVSAKAGGLSWAEGNVIGILMNCRGLLVLVVALAAFNEGVISAQLQVAGVLMALITTMMTGPLFDKFLPSVAKSAPPTGKASATSG